MSKPRREGYLCIDHRDSPGVDPALAAEVERRTGRVAPAPGKGVVFESATVTCTHCSAVVVLNPGRTRPRHYCPSCDGYVCDGCDAARVVHGCRPLEKTLDALQEEFARLAHRGDPISAAALDPTPIYQKVSVSVPDAAPAEAAGD
jgi:hypothetical protein